MAPMTAIKPPDTAPSTPEFSGIGTILNPATGAIAGEVHWTDPADVPTIAAGPLSVNGSSAGPTGAPRR